MLMIEGLSDIVKNVQRQALPLYEHFKKTHTVAEMGEKFGFELTEDMERLIIEREMGNE